MTSPRDDERIAGPRICFVTTDFVGVIRNGGIGTHFWLMSQLLSQRGWVVHVLFCGAVDDEAAMAAMPERMAAENIQFTWLEGLPAPSWAGGIPSYGDGEHTLLLSQRAFEALEHLHAIHNFDMIEFADWGALGFRSIQAKRSNLAFSDVALAVKLHSTTDWQRRGNLAQRKSAWELKMEWCEQYAFEHADIQLSPSQYMIADTRQVGWDVRDDVIVAYPFPDREPEPVTQTASAIRELVFFGRLERRKGLDIFLDALVTLPAGLPVLFLGRDTFIDGRRATAVIQERIGSRPYRIAAELDRQGALAELRSGDRLAVIASQSETFGFTVAECIANSIPFLAARVGGIPEVLRHPEARDRWLFQPTADGLSSAVLARLESDGLKEVQLRREAAAACEPTSWNDQVEILYRKAATALTSKPSWPPPSTTVSVVVTHFNYGEFLPSALASLAAQTRPADEVFVIDDGSTEESSRRTFLSLKDVYPDWTFLEQDNSGPGAARNRCLLLASGTYFLPFDSDNIAAPTMIETYLSAVSRDPLRAATSCHTLAFIEHSDIEAGKFAFRYAPTGGPRILAGAENLFGDTCALFLAEALRDVGGFETDRSSPHEDWETLTKLAFAGYAIDVAPRTLFYYRTDVGGRLQSLTADPAHTFALHRRMVDNFLVDVQLTRAERRALWECLVAFSKPSDEARLLQQQHAELVEWTAKTLADSSAWRERQVAGIHEWREAQLEENRAFLQSKIDEATKRAELAELKLSQLGRPDVTLESGAAVAELAPVGRLYAEALRRTLRGGLRRVARAADTTREPR